MTKARVSAERATWGDRAAQYSKSIAATLTSAAGLGVSLSQYAPAEAATAITAGVSLAVGFATWLITNTEIIRGAGNAVEDLGDVLDGPDR